MDYDEVRPDVAEASERVLKDVQKIDAPNAKSVQSDLDETDLSEGQELSGAIVRNELVGSPRVLTAQQANSR